MSHPVRRRTVALVLGALFATLSAAPVAARPTSARRSVVTVSLRPAGLLDRLWSSLHVLWSEAGCTIDPDGAKCANSPSGGGVVVSPPPNGCSIDPNGVGCASAAASQAPAGCTIDPNGCI